MPVSDLHLPIADHSWKIFGALTVVIPLGLLGTYCAWRGFSTMTETARVDMVAEPVTVVARPLPTPPPPLPVAAQLLSWQDVTLMLRAGFNDDEIIAASRGRQLSNVIGPAEAAMTRDLGAGGKLLAFLRTRPLYVAPSVAPRVVVTAPALTPVNRQLPARNAPMAAPVDRAARDRQVKNLQKQIDDLDEQIRYARAHPDSYSPLGTYNGRGYLRGSESPLKKYLDQLDQQRNDLRRQKWQLEGR